MLCCSENVFVVSCNLISTYYVLPVLLLFTCIHTELGLLGGWMLENDLLDVELLKLYILTYDVRVN